MIHPKRTPSWSAVPEADAARARNRGNDAWSAPRFGVDGLSAESQEQSNIEARRMSLRVRSPDRIVDQATNRDSTGVSE